MIEVRNLSKTFYVKSSPVRKPSEVLAVNDVSFAVSKGDCFGLIGESGSGKTTVGNIIAKLLVPDSGDVLYEGQSILHFSPNQVKQYRKCFQVVFQQSRESLDSKRTVREILVEPMTIHGIGRKRDREAEAQRLLELVGLSPDYLDKQPTELSGGQKQRVGIARALSVKPDIILLDEPLSALDVSVQGQIINLLNRLKDEMALTYILITHDLNVVGQMCNRVGIMKGGQLHESGDVQSVLDNPQHPYTAELVAASHL